MYQCIIVILVYGPKDIMGEWKMAQESWHKGKLVVKIKTKSRLQQW